MNVLSLFDGISCGQVALKKAGMQIDKYYASEIYKHPIQITQNNYPETVQIGDVTKINGHKFRGVELMMGGSPCQGFSFAGKQLNFIDPQSRLFFEYVRILGEVAPKYFLLENVKMKKEYQAVISEKLGCEPVEINSALVSAQNRKRLYWTNIPGVTQPEDKGLLLRDIIEDARTDKEKSYCLDACYAKGASVEQYAAKKRRQLVQVGAFRGRDPKNPANRTAGAPTVQRLEINKTGKSNTLTGVQKDNVLILAGHADIKGHDYNRRVYSTEGKSPSLRAASGGNLEPKVAIREEFYKSSPPRVFTDKSPTVRKDRVGLDISPDSATWRKLSPVECERLQTVPDNYTAHVSNSQRYKMLGNGWTVDVIAHIFRGLKNA